MGLTLGPVYDRPFHEKPWCNYGQNRGSPECPRYDYRITAGYNDPDILNGGTHRATDAGNAAIGWPIISPASCKVRGLIWFDGALGNEWDLGGGWTLEAWHLSEVASPVSPVTPAERQKGVKQKTGLWVSTERGERSGTTGNTGASLPDGSPMPAHTHWVLKKKGVPVDAAPYLYLDGKPGLPIEGATNDMGYYDDVPDDHQFASDVEWARQKGITGGTSSNPPLFSPDKPVTRAQMTAFLHRYDNVHKKEEHAE